MAHERHSWSDTTKTFFFRVAQRQRRKQRFVLEQVEGPGAPQRNELEGEEVIVGRSREADITISSKMMSRKHVRLSRSGPEFVALDLDSKYGMYLNGVKAHSAILRDGDVLQLGDAVFVFQEGG